MLESSDILLCSFLKHLFLSSWAQWTVSLPRETANWVFPKRICTQNLWWLLDKRHGRTHPNQDGRNWAQSSKQLYSLEMLSERLNLWIFILFGRGFSSVNKTDFVQHMLRKKFGSTLKIQAWKLNLAKKRGGGSLKCFGAFRRKSILKLVQRIEKRLYELSDCCFSKCQHGNPNRKRWIGSLERKDWLGKVSAICDVADGQPKIAKSVMTRYFLALRTPQVIPDGTIEESWASKQEATNMEKCYQFLEWCLQIELFGVWKASIECLNWALD